MFFLFSLTGDPSICFSKSADLSGATLTIKRDADSQKSILEVSSVLLPGRLSTEISDPVIPPSVLSANATAIPPSERSWQDAISLFSIAFESFVYVESAVLVSTEGASPQFPFNIFSKNVPPSSPFVFPRI